MFSILEYDFNKPVNSLKFSEKIITKNNINQKYTKYAEKLINDLRKYFPLLKR